MSEPFLAEIRCFGFNFAPTGWATCNGQLLPISQNTALFSLLGTTYGGNGQSTFGLPNLQGRIPMHQGNGPGGFDTVLGEVLGSPTVQVISTEMPAHIHTVTAEEVTPGGLSQHTATPSGSTFFAQSQPNQVYNTSPTLNAGFASSMVGSTGASQPHDNMQPYLVLNFCIALQGIFPSRN